MFSQVMLVKELYASSEFPYILKDTRRYISFERDVSLLVLSLFDITMFSWLLLSCLFGFSLADIQDYQVCYKGSSSDNNICMKVDVDQLAMKVHYHMDESEDFDDVETLEDYSVGLAASRVGSQEACYVRRLVKSFEKQVAFIKGHQDDGMRVESDVRVSAVSLDNPEEEIGSDLANFCGDLPVYKLVNQEQNDSVQDRRQVSVTFTRCVLLCFIPRCFTTTLTLPTGSTVTFGWFFFG
ncbi:uncharacterized protein LOC122250033 [Penaeus japonicus]|uniref:uncharacterized protein LOC122250033 n=1 Tax=Penaeus japonicus TaxID=27405 RepID=UPI001C70B0F5|nr:uncharacterized protein LOC122250033 [Penaeus japonicus]